uniref:Protocadherin 2 alpha a 15 n=1 Tax=Gadus morhua TaxID=8049 RepID=A0A8C5AW75_GADMO
KGPSLYLVGYNDGTKSTRGVETAMVVACDARCAEPFEEWCFSTDPESVAKHRLMLTAFDGGKPAKSGTIEINVDVLDVNDNSPVFQKDVYSTTLIENASIGTIVIQVNATDLDGDANAEVRYSFGNEVDERLTELFSVDSLTGEIRVVGLIDFEKSKSYEIDVQASDKGPVPLSADKSVIISIIDVNDNAPEIEVTSFSSTVPEDARIGTTVALISVKEGTVVGHIAKDLGLDKSTLRNRGYRIVHGSSEPLFQVNKDDGILYVNRKIDREDLCERSKACVIELKTALENPLEVHYIAVEVLDVNDNSPSFPEMEKTLEMYESALPGARFQLHAAHDGDSGLLSVQQYKLSPNEHFRLEVKDRGEDRKTPILILQKSLDRESVKTHHLLLTAVDGGKPPKSGEMKITVLVVDVNDNHPVFTKDSYSVQLPENTAIGTTIIQVNATDLDDGSNGEIVYSFSDVVHGKVREYFNLNVKTGEITVSGILDFEERNRYEIDLQASDKGTIAFTTDTSVIINIIDVNDNAPEIEVTSFSKSLPEDCKSGTTVAVITVKDSDSGVNGKVLCFINQDVPFTLTSSVQNNMFSIVTKTPLDREKQSQYDVTIIAKDAGEPSLSSEKTIRIDISDVNDNSPQFLLSPYTFYLTENNSPGDSIFKLQATDQDEGDNALISYHIFRGGENVLSSFLNINPVNGDISALKNSGSPSLSSNVSVNVFLLDQNDNPPVILHPVSSNGSAEGVEEVPRNVPAGHLVTKVRAWDRRADVEGAIAVAFLFFRYGCLSKRFIGSDTIFHR